MEIKSKGTRGAWPWHRGDSLCSQRRTREAITQRSFSRTSPTPLHHREYNTPQRVSVGSQIPLQLTATFTQNFSFFYWHQGTERQRDPVFICSIKQGRNLQEEVFHFYSRKQANSGGKKTTWEQFPEKAREDQVPPDLDLPSYKPSELIFWNTRALQTFYIFIMPFTKDSRGI